MVGFDIASTIVVRRTIEKGTKIVEEPLKKLNFVGVEFKKYQKRKLQIAGDIGLSSSKGTDLIHLSKMFETQVPSEKGLLMSTGRGTGIRMG
ncbi:MAG: hypothetical protein JRZ95_05530 [Nitrososphaerota archaeon]|jgi:hypothetical protein|nr:hypothetical protein [Nitrososphaerota archaeon]